MTVVVNKKQFSAISDSGATASGSGNELLPFIERDNQIFIDARLLHKRLESKQQFSHWIQDKIEDFDFVENRDFQINLSKSSGGRRSIDYLLTLDMAKELAMLERSKIGSQVRRYFIEVEKHLVKIFQLPTTEALFTGIPSLISDGVPFFDYKEVLTRCGYNPKTGYSRRRRYPKEFIQEGKYWYVSEKFSLHLHQQKAVMENRKVFGILGAPIQPNLQTKTIRSNDNNY